MVGGGGVYSVCCVNTLRYETFGTQLFDTSKDSSHSEILVIGSLTSANLNDMGIVKLSLFF